MPKRHALAKRPALHPPPALVGPHITMTQGIRWTYYGRGCVPVVVHRGSEYAGWLVPRIRGRSYPFAGFAVSYDNERGAHSWFDFTPAEARHFPVEIRRSIFARAALAAARNGAPGLTGDIIERWFMEPNRLIDGTLALESQVQP